jgi:hypothetical protein
MLIENKFIYLSLPRCASTSFLITCLRNDIDIKHYNDLYYGKMNETNDLSLDNEKLADQLLHGHEKLVDLRKKFGYEYPAVGIRRNKYERFLSLWKHIIDLTDNLNHLYSPEVSKILSNLTLEDVLFYKSEDLVIENKAELINQFINRNGLSDYINQQNYTHFLTMVFITINPLSFYHNNDPNIIWFDYNNLGEFEEWVSKTISRPFKLEKSNSSKTYKTNILINEEFVRKYDEIYQYFDEPKKVISLI